jgi:uncharacterized protein (TIGR02996 family)
VIHVSVRDVYSTRTYAFARDTVVVGKGPDVDLVLDKDGVAARHIQIVRRGDEVYIDDLRRAQEPRAVEPDDVIRVAGIDLQVALRPLAFEIHDDLERQMLADIRARPDDADTRAVYADWLEQHGHDARAEFLRVQIAIGAVKVADDPAFVKAAARLAELAPIVGDGWRVRVAMAFVERCPSTRGRRVQLEMVCPMRWDLLEPTEREDVRTCRTCAKSVTYCTSVDQAKVLAEGGHCVAVDVREKRSKYDLDPPRMVGWPSPPLSRYGRDR